MSFLFLWISVEGSSWGTENIGRELREGFLRVPWLPPKGIACLGKGVSRRQWVLNLGMSLHTRSFAKR